MSTEPGTPQRPDADTDTEGQPAAVVTEPTGIDQGKPVQTPTTPRPELTLKRTRISGAWFAIGAFAVVLLLLLIFILQNNHTVEVSYLGVHGHLPLGVALLLAAVAGVLLTVLVGAARIIQLRAVARRHRRGDARYAASEQAADGPASPPASA
jgi:lipopolysaccharide assembly protein A